jgi:hypothetical protein
MSGTTLPAFPSVVLGRPISGGIRKGAVTA